MLENKNSEQNIQPTADQETDQVELTENTVSPEITEEADSSESMQDAQSEESLPQETQDSEDLPTETLPTESAVTYRWDYQQQAASDDKQNRRKQRRGAATYAVVMTVCFAVCFAILLTTLWAGWGGVAFFPTDRPAGSDSADREGGLSMQEISAMGNPVVVAISVKTTLGGGIGTGIIMTENGYIATNSHVVEGAKEITVQLYDGTKYQAELIGQSDIDDLAVVKINAKRLPCATFGKSSEAVVGDRVVAIGHPAGLEFGWTSTFGRVSAINRDVKIRDTDGTMIKRMTLIQTDANVNSGNSGGPMFNDRGEVIGIITLKLAGDYEGLGFAIPIDAALPLLTALMEKGTTDGVHSGVASGRPQLGITGVMVEKDAYYVVFEDRIQKLTEEEAAQVEGSFKALATGVLVTAVASNSDAYGKIEVGDIMIAIDGETIESFEYMREHLYDCDIGDTVTIEYVRKDGNSGAVNVLLKPAQ